MRQAIFVAVFLLSPRARAAAPPLRVVVDATEAARHILAPAMRLVAVNGRRFTADLAREAVRDTRSRPDLDLLSENGDLFRSHRVAYRGGARYPTLERLPGRGDLLEAIYRSAAPPR